MNDDDERDEGMGDVKFSVGIGGDPHGHDPLNPGVSVDTPPLRFMTLGQKIGIVVFVLLGVLLAVCQIMDSQ